MFDPIDLKKDWAFLQLLQKRLITEAPFIYWVQFFMFMWISVSSQVLLSTTNDKTGYTCNAFCFGQQNTALDSWIMLKPAVKFFFNLGEKCVFLSYEIAISRYWTDWLTCCALKLMPGPGAAQCILKLVNNHRPKYSLLRTNVSPASWLITNLYGSQILDPLQNSLKESLPKPKVHKFIFKNRDQRTVRLDLKYTWK